MPVISYLATISSRKILTHGSKNNLKSLMNWILRIAEIFAVVTEFNIVLRQLSAQPFCLVNIYPWQLYGTKQVVWLS